MGFLDHQGESELPFTQEKVFNAILQAIPTIEGMEISTFDKLQSRIVVKAGISIMSWGENIPIQLSKISENKTKIKITSTPKTGILFGGAFDLGKNRNNIEQILSATSRILSSEIYNNFYESDANNDKFSISFQIHDSNTWNNIKIKLIDFYKEYNFTKILIDKEESFMLGCDEKKGYISMTLDKNIITIVTFKVMKLDSDIIDSITNLNKNKVEALINEDEIYEKIMIEIENDKKIKSTWAKSFAQSNGDENKANALYINLRIEEIKKSQNI